MKLLHDVRGGGSVKKTRSMALKDIEPHYASPEEMLAFSLQRLSPISLS
jgi:hypothetical protein